MELRHIAMVNLRRRKSRAMLAVAGLSVAVAAFVLVLSLIASLRAGMDDKLSRYGSNLVVTPARPDLSLSYGGLTVAGAGSANVTELTEEDLEAVRSVPSAGRLAAVLPVLLQEVQGEGRPLLALGTDVEASAAVKLWWRVEGSLPQAADEVLLGLNVRNQLGLDAGDELKLDGRPFRVSGVLWETGGEEDNVVIMQRPALEQLTGHAGRINMIEVTADSSEVVDTLTAELASAVPGAQVSSVKQSLEFTDQGNAALAAFGGAVTVLIVLLSGLVVMITMLTSVKERQKEIGIFRALGFKQRHVARLVMLETLVMSGGAAVLGVALGLVGGLLVPRLVDELSFAVAVQPLVIAAGVALSFIVGLAAALYPARRAAAMDPAAALKHV